MKLFDYSKLMRWTATALCVLSLALALAGCSWDQNQSALDPKGPVAKNQYDLFMLTLYITMSLWVVVGGFLIYTVIKFRLKKTDDPNEIPEQSHGHPLIEVGLILASAIILVVLAIPTFKGIVFMKAPPPEHGADDAMVVNVYGLQWWWRFEYPELGIETANELVFPAGRAIKLNLRSEDVIHSFWLPKLAGKIDLIPGQENAMWVKSDEPGYFWGQCAEYCGDSHAYMLFRAIAHTEEDFNNWVSKQKAGPLLPANGEIPEIAQHPNGVQIEAGRELFRKNCVSCHKIGDFGGETGPNLSHVGSRSTIAAGWLANTPENLHKWILEPHAVKPGNYMWKGVPLGLNPDGSLSVMAGLDQADLTSADVDAIVAYLVELK